MRPVGLLASVATGAEMALAHMGGADIIDLKDPARGALGAWRTGDLSGAVALWRSWSTGNGGDARPVPRLSATIGDHPLAPDPMAQAAARVAALGVPLVKIGFALPAHDAGTALAACLARLAPLARTTSLVAVLFADQKPDLSVVPQVAAAGFAGVMLDTADKSHGSLRTHLPDDALAAFLATARAHGLMTGLAGALRREDIAPLAALGPDYLGFRGALCAAGRTSALDPACLADVRRALRIQAAA